MPTLDYQPSPRTRHSLTARRTVILATAASAVLLLWTAAGWLLDRTPRNPVTVTSLPPGPPKYYQAHEFLELDDMGGEGWRVYKSPAIPGPYRVLDDQLRVQSGVGGPASGWIGTPQGRLPFDVPGVPDTSLLVVGVANETGEHGFFVLSRPEPPPDEATQPNEATQPDVPTQQPADQ
jgi:hypothetical protein